MERDSHEVEADAEVEKREKKIMLDHVSNLPEKGLNELRVMLLADRVSFEVLQPATDYTNAADDARHCVL